MHLNQEVIKDLESKRKKIPEELNALADRFHYKGIEFEHSHPQAYEYMAYGVAMRINLLDRAVENIFDIFPLQRTERLAIPELQDVQINLHAFTINLHGLLDNMAWAFVLRHDLYQNQIRGRLKVSLYKEATFKHFSDELKDYVIEQKNTEWYEKHAKESRDSLAHRIPPSIVGSQLTKEEEKWLGLFAQSELVL